MDNQATGLFIKQLRIEKNLTQKELADRLHVTDKAVSKWERGLSLPAVDLLQPLSQALGISVVELLDAQCHQDNSIDLQKANAILEDTTRRLKKTIRRNDLPSHHLHSPLHHHQNQRPDPLESRPPSRRKIPWHPGPLLQPLGQHPLLDPLRPPVPPPLDHVLCRPAQRIKRLKKRAG